MKKTKRKHTDNFGFEKNWEINNYKEFEEYNKKKKNSYW